MARRTPTFTYSLPGEALDFSDVDAANTADLERALRARSARSARSAHCTMRRLKRRFARYDTLTEAVAALAQDRILHRTLLRDLSEELVGLWNYTARDDLGGRRPIELYLEATFAGADPHDSELLARTRFVIPVTGIFIARPDAQ